MTEEFVPSFLDKGSALDYEIIPTDNGLILQSVCIPEEIMLQIFTLMEPKELLKYTLVCQQWNKLIKSHWLWSLIYKKKYNKIANPDLPWFLYYSLLTTEYFDTNLLFTKEGKTNYKYWNTASDNVDDESISSTPLDNDLAKFVMIIKTHMKIHARNWNRSEIPKILHEYWLLYFDRNKLFRYILDTYKPHIYLNDCGSIHELQMGILNDCINPYTLNRGSAYPRTGTRERTKYEEMEFNITGYPKHLDGLLFETQHFNGWLTTDLKNAEVIISFDSIDPLPINEQGDVEKKSSDIQFNCKLISPPAY